jgi:hypothetical protein
MLCLWPIVGQQRLVEEIENRRGRLQMNPVRNEMNTPEPAILAELAIRQQLQHT